MRHTSEDILIQALTLYDQGVEIPDILVQFDEEDREEIGGLLSVSQTLNSSNNVFHEKPSPHALSQCVDQLQYSSKKSFFDLFIPHKRLLGSVFSLALVFTFGSYQWFSSDFLPTPLQKESPFQLKLSPNLSQELSDFDTAFSGFDEDLNMILLSTNSSKDTLTLDSELEMLLTDFDLIMTDDLSDLDASFLPLIQ